MDSSHSCFIGNQSHRERGISIIVFTIASVLVVLPLIGLAVDGSIVFWTKAKLTSALDAAALAAGRSPTSDPNTVAQQYVYANLPSGWMGTTYTVTPTATIDYPTTGSRRVTITASVSVPLYFMRIIGVKTSTVGDSAASTRRNVNVVLLLDRSGSMNITGPDGNVVCDTMKASAQTFVNFFTDGQDQLGLVTFHAWSNVDFAFSTHFQTSSNTNGASLNTILADLQCGDNTASAQGLDRAYQQIISLGPSAYANTGSLNVILFMTDGFPNGVTMGQSSYSGSAFIPKDQADDRYCVGTTSSICTNTPATATACQNSLKTALPGTLVQDAGGTSGFPYTGSTNGFWQIFNSSSPAPTSTCASGATRAICNMTTPEISADSTCTFVQSGSQSIRKDVAYISPQDIFGNKTVNTSYMTQSSDLVQTGPYTGLGHRVDTPQAIMDASFNAADAEALKIIQDTNFKPSIYVIGLGGAADVASEDSFLRFLNRVANVPASDRYNSNLPVGLFVYSPDDTQLQSAFRQVASQILRLSK